MEQTVAGAGRPAPGEEPGRAETDASARELGDPAADAGAGGQVTDVVIITGMSGAGRSTAAKTLEDLDWFVIDNLPPGLLPTMINLARRAKGALPRIAAVMDVRSRAFSSDLQSAIAELATHGVRPRARNRAGPRPMPAHQGWATQHPPTRAPAGR